MERYIKPYVLKDLEKKIVFITGPRQVGKTTLAKSIVTTYEYFNYDYAEHRLALKEKDWNRKSSLVIFDELHKMKLWKGWLKGVYDVEGINPKLLVTGSAKLNTFKKVGDSMAGRYFQFRLHPFDLKEAKPLFPSAEIFNRLWNCSGFPEPFLDGDPIFYQRWKRSHVDIILRQDLLDLQNVRDIQSIETLIELLRINVGSTISYANLARSLERDAKTIKKWLQLLEDLYLIFKITPYSKNVNRSLLKEPKYYFFDFAPIENNGAKLENLVASALLKELHFIEDLYGVVGKLHFLKTKNGHETDFLITVNNKPKLLLEVKWSDENPDKNLFHFEKYFPEIKKIQLVKEIKREKTFKEHDLEVVDLISWLQKIDFSSFIKK